jgi:hypothetical protein
LQADVERQFREDYVDQQSDIEIHIRPKMTAVIQGLTSAVAASFSKARQEKLAALNGIHEQIRGKAEQTMKAVQVCFVAKAQAEIQSLSDSEVNGFIQQLMRKRSSAAMRPLLIAGDG